MLLFLYHPFLLLFVSNLKPRLLSLVFGLDHQTHDNVKIHSKIKQGHNQLTLLSTQQSSEFWCSNPT